MPPRYTVRAQVIDIRTDTPRPDDAFLVDTNVLYWTIYSGAGALAGSATPAQMSSYSAYFWQGIGAGATAYRTGVCLAELTHLIEQNERDAYATGVASVSTKQYRHNLSSERTRVVGEIQKVWAKVKLHSQSLTLLMDDATSDAVLLRLSTQPVDGFDLFLLEAMSTADVNQVLTDDGDFCTVPGLQVFTANPRVIAAARSAGLLVVR
jgi:hypothetical protein